MFIFEFLEVHSCCCFFPRFTKIFSYSLQYLQLITPNASFVGHLAGIFVGLLYTMGPLKSVVDFLENMLSLLFGKWPFSINQNRKFVYTLWDRTLFDLFVSFFFLFISDDQWWIHLFHHINPPLIHYQNMSFFLSSSYSEWQQAK